MVSHAITIREDSETWIRQHSGSIFKPETNIPEFHTFNSGRTVEPLEDYEYDDLVFLPIVAFFLSQLPKFSGPKLYSLLSEFRNRAEEFSSDADLASRLSRSFPCLHQVGISLDGEDAADLDSVIEIARNRAARIGSILQMDFSTPESTRSVSDSMTDEELVDLFIYGLLAEDDFPQVEFPKWAVDQAESSLRFVEGLDSSGGPDLTYGRVIDGVPEFLHEPRFVGSVDDYPLYLLVSTTTGVPSELVCNNRRNDYVRVSGKWGAMPPTLYWSENFKKHEVKRNPPLKYELIQLWDEGMREEISLEKFTKSETHIELQKINEPSKSSLLTEEEKEQFLTNWSETMPEVLTWSDEEIAAAILQGM